MTQIEKIQELVEELAELVDERQEKQEFHEQRTEKGDGWEADQIYETIQELDALIQAQKKFIELKLREI